MRIRKFALFPITLSIAACSGGGGGGSGINSFTQWSAITPNSTTQISGTTTEAAYTSQTSSPFAVLSHTAPTEGTGTVTVVTDGSGNQSSVTVTGSQSSVSFNQSNATSTDLSSIGVPDAIYTQSNDGTKILISANQQALGYEYQSFGVWATGLGTGSGNVGAISVGAKTAGSDVPTSGGGTFTGYGGGVYIDSAGIDYAALGDATLIADFGNRTVDLTISNTNKIAQNTQVVSSATNLNLSGQLTYTAGSNSYTGPITTTGGMTGQATGSFYGPGAVETGGTFSATGTGVESYIGAFGAKR